VVTSKINKIGDEDELYSVYSEDTASLSGSAYAPSNGSGPDVENAYTSVSVLVNLKRNIFIYIYIYI